MKIKLDILQKHRQQLFFDYLKAAFRLRCPTSQSEGIFDDNGIYTATLNGDFSLGDGIPFPLRWTITRQLDGIVKGLQVEPLDPTKTPADWKSLVQEFINTEILLPALAEKSKKFFWRSTFHYVGTALDGEYWLPKFRLAPALPEDEIPMMVLTERVIYIEQEVNAIDYRHAQLVAEEIAKRIAARLSLILNTGLYKPDSEHRWFLKFEPSQTKITSERRQLGFVPPKPMLNSLPKKGAQCPAGIYEGSVLGMRGSVLGGKLVCPRETRKILRGVEDDDSTFKDAFDNCARLYQVALSLGQRFPTASLAYQIAAVEAITINNSEYGSFSDFMRRNLPAIDGLDKFLDWLYGSVRSAHFHTGAFPLGDFLASSFEFLDWESHERVNRQFNSQAIIRQAIMTWTLKKIAERSKK